jgi:uncharacterized protein YndB with AHSA1/START domain
MTSNAGSGHRLLGRLDSVDGKGVVRIEDRYDTGIDDLWSALTDPARLARWYGEVEGDLRPAGEYRLHVMMSDWEGTGRVEVCEPPRRLRVTGREAQETFNEVIEATLTADGDQTILVIETSGMTLDKVPFYGAGWQVHAEDLAGYLAGRERATGMDRWNELAPRYQELAASLGQ